MKPSPIWVWRCDCGVGRARTGRPRPSSPMRWDHLNDLVDDLDARLLDTLMWRPDLGVGLLTAGFLMMEVVPEVSSFSVRPAEADEGPTDGWIIAASVDLAPSEALDRLNAFDAEWIRSRAGLGYRDVIATINLV